MATVELVLTQTPDGSTQNLHKGWVCAKQDPCTHPKEGGKRRMPEEIHSGPSV